MLISALVGGKDVAASGAATSQAQLLADSVVDSLRQSTDISLTDFDGDGQLLRATHHTFDANGAETSWVFMAWAVTSDGRAYLQRSCAPIVDPASQDPSDFAGWLLLASGLEPAATPAPTATPSPGAPILTQSGTTVRIAARGDAMGGAPALVDTSITPHQLPSTLGAGTC
jgi:hypothetical protein